VHAVDIRQLTHVGIGAGQECVDEPRELLVLEARHRRRVVDHEQDVDLVDLERVTVAGDLGGLAAAASEGE
jgi:hypothetical protein